MALAKSIGVLSSCPPVVTISVEIVADVDALTIDVLATGITAKGMDCTTLACFSFLSGVL